MPADSPHLLLPGWRIGHLCLALCRFGTCILTCKHRHVCVPPIGVAVHAHIHTYHTFTYTHTLAHMHTYTHRHKYGMHSYVYAHLWYTFIVHTFMHMHTHTLHVHICAHLQCTFIWVHVHTPLPVSMNVILPVSLSFPDCVCLSLLLSLVPPSQRHDSELKVSSLFS